MSETASILNAAADICERGWAQRAWARDRQGAKVGGASVTAVCWCAGDAIFQAAKVIAPQGYFGAVQTACRALRRHINANIATWNDAPARTQAEVVETLREAARLA